MDIGIFIEYDNRVVQIPVNPEKFQIKTGGNNTTTEVIALGEVVIPRKKKLSSISWDCFFPYESWYPAIRTTGAFESADFYVNFITKIRDDCRPCHLTVTGIGFDDDVVIESFDYYHQAGDHEDTYYSITLKRYQHYSVSIVSKVDIESQLKPTTSTQMGEPPSNSSVTLQPTQITIGCEVILNGRVHLDSYGSKPGKSFTNYKVKVNLINKKGTHPYHVTTLSGSHLGWVTEESVSFSGAPSKSTSTSTTTVKKVNPPLKNDTVQTFSPILRGGTPLIDLANSLLDGKRNPLEYMVKPPIGDGRTPLTSSADSLPVGGGGGRKPQTSVDFNY